jgi:hypothetical protein
MTDTVYMVLYFALFPALLALCFVLDRVWPCAPGAGPRRAALAAWPLEQREEMALPHGRLRTAG